MPTALPPNDARALRDEDGALFAEALDRYAVDEKLNQSVMQAALLPNGRLASRDGLVITHDGLVAVESAWNEQHLLRTGILDRRRLPKAVRVAGRQASLISQWCDAYYHWMTDVLPKILVLERAGWMDAALVVPEGPTTWQRRSLELMGVSNKLTPFTGYLQAEVLVWPRQVAITGHIPSWACESLRQRLVPRAGSRGHRRLYLTRGNDTRKLSNEEDVWPLLRAMDFEVVDAGTLTLDEQIRVFAEAAVIVGPHGGAFTNLLFAQDATVIELFDPGYVNPCFYALADRCGHSYWYLMGRPTRNGCFEIDVARLESTLAAALTE